MATGKLDPILVRAVAPRDSSPADPEIQRRWALLLAHRDHAMSVARSRVSDTLDAEDLVHEAFLRVVALPHVDEQTVAGLLSTVIVRLAVDDFRQRTRTTELSRRLTGHTPPAPPVDEQVCDDSEARWLADRLDALNPNDRDVLLGRCDGVDSSAVARSLGLTPKAAQCALTRARRALKALWHTTLLAAACASVDPAAALAEPTATESAVTMPPVRPCTRC